jgi:hypothetical protein
MKQRPRPPADPARQAQIRGEMQRERDQRASGYRERALKLFGHVCGRCGREFEGARLKELTVHHRDHNHNNNPPDGSNWELLCLYCHDHEHEKPSMAGHAVGAVGESLEPSKSIFSPFGALDALVKPKSDVDAKAEEKPASPPPAPKPEAEQQGSKV